MLKNKVLKNEDEDLSTFSHLNIEKLFDRYVDLNTGLENLANFDKNDAVNENDDGDDDDFKTLKQEYEQIKNQMKIETEKSNIKLKKTCNQVEDSNYKNMFSNEEEMFLCGHNYPFTCSLNNTFEMHTSILNNFNFYP